MHNIEDAEKRRARMNRLRQRRIAAGLDPKKGHTCHLPTALRKDHPVNRAIHTLAKEFGFKPSEFTDFINSRKGQGP